MTDADISILDLLHPSGEATQLVAIGGACPPFLTRAPRPRPERPAAAECEIDALLLAPTEAECRSPEWLEANLRAIRLVAAGGLVYACIPRGLRARVRRLMTAAGLVEEVSYLHAPYGGTGHFLISLDRAVMRHTLRVHPPRGRKAAVIRAIAAVPGMTTIAARGWSQVGTVFRPAGAPPSIAWAAEWLGEREPAKRSVIRHRVAGDSATAVLVTFGATGRFPVTVLKVPLSERSRNDREREGEAIGSLAANASTAGAAVPSVDLQRFPFGPALRLGVVGGVPAYAILGEQPERLAGILGSLAAWLGRWNESTRHEAPGRRWLESEILEPAMLLGRHLPRGGEYVDWLREAIARLDPGTIPAVAAHNDLTMVNVLLDGDRLGVIDWESAREDGLPLTDYYYAAGDAAAAAGRYRDRAGAFIAALDPRTELGRSVRSGADRLAHAVSLGAEPVGLMRHACVVHHAANDLRKEEAAERPYLRVAAWLAERTLAGEAG